MSNDKMKDAFKKRYPSRAIELEIEKTGAISRLESINARHKFAAFEQGWQACAEEMQQSQTIPEWDGMDQDWKGMSGAIAFHLIDRHADGWDQIGAMMDAWMDANKMQQDVGINGLTREEEGQTASVMGVANQDHIADVRKLVHEPVKFLCDGTRFKLSFFDGDTDEVGNCQSYVISLSNFKSELDGRWVALVPAENNCHLALTSKAKRLSDDEIDTMTTAMWGKQLGVIMQAHREYARAIEAKILGEQA